MRIESGAGDFEMTVLEVVPNGHDLVFKSQMGVWKADAILTPRELMGLLWLHLRPRVLLYLLCLPWFAWRG